MTDVADAKLFIDGKFREAANGARFDVIDPCDESLVGTAADATLEDVADAVTAARRAFDETSWSEDRAFRARCLRQLQDGLRKEATAIKDMQTAEGAIPASVRALVDSEIEEMAYHIELIDSFEWETDFAPHEILGMRSHRRVRYEPYGVVGAITPWNSPFMLNNWKTVPALATGNTVVLKTAPETPISGAMLARVIQEHTDIPAGVVNVISSSDNAVGGDGLTGDPRVDMFHFTGSTAVGQRIAERAAKGIRKVVLELGGKSANLVLADADLDIAIPFSAGMCMLNSGQGCTLATRLIVHASIYDEVLELLQAVVSVLPWGDPRDEATVVGPIIRADQVDRIEGLVDRAVEAGARIVVGGKRADRNGKGFWFEPTVIADVDENSEIAQTEVFGPVLSVLKFDGDDDEAVRIANNTMYGLSGYIQTRDLDRAWRIAYRLRTGTVNIGPSAFQSPNVPFGGYGMSGLGREHGIEGWREFLQTKSIATPAT
jgi:aldehyde dehydrogenase (NAD+)